MLTDTALRNLKPRPTPYKVGDRDGMYVLVAPTGLITFRYDYRLNGRRETLTIGRYNPRGLTLALAREKCLDARNAVARGESPARAKSHEKRRLATAETFGEIAEQWFLEADLAESTRAMRRGVYTRDVYPEFKKHLLTEITEEDVRALCEKVKARNAPATALHVREVIKSVFDFAALKGHKMPNPAEKVLPKSIATFKPRDRALSPLEIRVVHRCMEHTQARPDHRLALRLILLTLVRKGELIGATWDEVSFEFGIWTIPKERMKAREPHNVYLSRQALEIFKTLKVCAGSSKYVLPSRNDLDAPISPGSLNRVAELIAEEAKKRSLPLGGFTLHDLRRTGSTLLNEIGFNGDWIEKALAHEHSYSSRGVYNKAQYAEQRKHMLQQWADIIDAWVAGKAHTPVLLPPSTSTIIPQVPFGVESHDERIHAVR